MEGKKGKEMKRNAMEWKKKAEEAVGAGGSSSLNLDKLFSQVLPPNSNKVIRPDLVNGGEEILLSDFMAVIRDRSLLLGMGGRDGGGWWREERESGRVGEGVDGGREGEGDEDKGYGVEESEKLQGLVGHLMLTLIW
ncbi:UDP-glycosyltransferase 85A8 [Camellia lanceoleosa]|uniref:UDP-glycosyltransferase 85A8 n=1 Tax=Camellia lanceoleosa TaxID=1840588 RepID=A0ACC0IPW2_9ERIC|nr:UDP-glycosyltransferase 85A8 [Camellia lanceoleosa]